jgi:hypothetical protein
MKKITIALMCMIMATGAAMAQKQFTFGPKIGVDYTHFWDADGDYSGVLNYQAGLFMEYRFTDRFSIAPEVVFAAQGGKFKWIENGSNEISSTYHMNYINIPVMFKFYVIPQLSIDLGPQLGVNVYHKATDKWKLLGQEYKETSELNGVKSIDFGVGLGLTYNIAKDVFVQGRYTMGVTKAFENGSEKNGNAQIAIGYRF